MNPGLRPGIQDCWIVGFPGFRESNNEIKAIPYNNVDSTSVTWIGPVASEADIELICVSLTYHSSGPI